MVSIEEKPVPRPPGAPESWPQPPSDGIFGQWGYCGATAAANLLRWYGREVSPKEAIAKGCWSYLAGTFPGTLRDCINAIAPNLDCSLGNARARAPLDDLRAHLQDGHPVIVLYMTGVFEAHWVVVTGVEGDDSDANVIAMSDAHYISLRWSELGRAWGLAYDGPFPTITCQAKTSLEGLRP